tara:strand:+ start:878 stop:1141 length:264 start_codon:yes stop_codon:yes gene_type:complete
MKVIKENCKLEDGQDTKLPYTCYIVTYKVDGEERHDLTMATKAADLFDYYYDLYKKDFVTFTQSAGRINPTLWNDPNSSKKSSKKKK